MPRRPMWEDVGASMWKGIHRTRSTAPPSTRVRLHAGSLRHAQVEPPHHRVEGLAVVAPHLVRAFHRAPHRPQRAEALVLERLPRLQPRRLAHYAGAAHLFTPAQ